MGICERNIAITDVETTGIDVASHEIIEIGLVVIAQPGLEIVSTLSIKVRPEYPERITEEAERINGYNAHDWRDAVSLREAMEQYAELVRGAIFAAHNPTFDYAFIAEAFRKTGIEDPMDYHRIDEWTLAWSGLRDRCPEKLGLSDIAILLGIRPEPYPHRAINGAMTSYNILKHLLGRGVEAG
ncbi:MAG: 3'-5' exonuclease [Patescibacteria group bacterium]|jgi:DNA polymerase-3 subunit epsilon